ncbi:MAG TPA: sigma factor, partial [Planctomycetota bacterium]|nr:sigma factor [Planctomycetota bacterium]
MLPGATDRLFLHFCRTGSARSLGKVFDRTAPELLRVAIYLSGNRADADDLVQRTFLTAIESRASHDRARRAMPWLLGILANLARRLQ